MKKILIVFLILVFCVGFVSASENISDTSLDDENNTQVMFVSKIYVNSSKLSNGNGSSWDEAYNGSGSWNEIHYNNDAKIDNCTVYLADGEYSQESPIHYDNCTFIGHGKNTCISFFADNVNSNAKCVFINITFVKNDAHDSIVTLRANYDFINCTFIDLSMVKIGWPSKTSASFKNCLFSSDCHAELFKNDYYANLKFDECIFENIKSDSIVYNDVFACTMLDNCIFRNCSINGILKSDEGYLAGSRIKNATYDKFLNKSPYSSPFYFNSTDEFELYVNESCKSGGDGSSWENAINDIVVYDGLTVHLAEGNYVIPDKMFNVTYVGLGDETVIRSFNFNGDGYYKISDNLVTVINATFIPYLQNTYIGTEFSYNIDVDGMNFQFIGCNFINSSFITRVYNKFSPDRDGVSQTCTIIFNNCVLKDYNGSYLVNNWEYSKFIFNKCVFENIVCDAIVDSYGGQMGANGISDGIFITDSIFNNCVLNGVVKARNIGNCEITNCSYDFDVSINKKLIAPFYINKTDFPLNETKLTITTKDNSVIITLTDVNASRPIVDVEVGIFNNNKIFGYYITDSNGQIILKDLDGVYCFEFSYPGKPDAYLPVSVNKTFTFTKTQSQTKNPLATPKVTKKVTKFTAKKATFKKSKKVKKYTITLKAGKNPVKKVKVYLKVKGKTYKATTNAKGKAIFKIVKLTRKGTFTAKITFKGNSLYKAVSKSVKIKVK